MQKKQPPIPGGMQEQFTPEGLKGVLLQATRKKMVNQEPAPINTVNLINKGISCKLNKVAAEQI